MGAGTASRPGVTVLVEVQWHDGGKQGWTIDAAGDMAALQELGKLIAREGPAMMFRGGLSAIKTITISPQ